MNNSGVGSKQNNVAHAVKRVSINLSIFVAVTGLALFVFSMRASATEKTILVTPSSVGKLKIGMKRGDLMKAMGKPRKVESETCPDDCSYPGKKYEILKWKDYTVYVSAGKVESIQTTSAKAETKEKYRIGTAKAKVKNLETQGCDGAQFISYGKKTIWVGSDRDSRIKEFTIGNTITCWDDC